METNCTVRRILFYIEGCIDDQELAGVMLGVFSAALWALVHISFYAYQRRNLKMNKFVTSTITIHMIADGFSCVGAILAQQKSLQVIFALFGTVVNSAIGLHGWCSKSCDNTTGDLNGNQKKAVTDKYHCLCSTVFLFLCLMFITMCVTEYLTITDDNVVYKNSTKLQPHRHTVLIAGYILGCVGTLSYWLSKFYEVVESYRNSKNRHVHTCMYLTAITGDTTYLLGIYIQMSTIVYVIQTLPWTLARMGLIGIHIGIILQRKCSMTGKKETDKVTLLKNKVEKSESDWSDDSSTVICGPCDLQTSVKQIICSDAPIIHVLKDDCIEANTQVQVQKGHYSDKQIPESPSVENPELEWDFEWQSDTRKRQFTDADVHKLSPYNGYYKVVEWFRRSCDTDYPSDTEDVIENNNSKKLLVSNCHDKVIK